MLVVVLSKCLVLAILVAGGFSAKCPDCSEAEAKLLAPVRCHLVRIGESAGAEIIYADFSKVDRSMLKQQDVRTWCGQCSPDERRIIADRCVLFKSCVERMARNVDGAVTAESNTEQAQDDTTSQLDIAKQKLKELLAILVKTANSTAGKDSGGGETETGDIQPYTSHLHPRAKKFCDFRISKEIPESYCLPVIDCHENKETGKEECDATIKLVQKTRVSVHKTCGFKKCSKEEWERYMDLVQRCDKINKS